MVFFRFVHTTQTNPSDPWVLKATHSSRCSWRVSSYSSNLSLFLDRNSFSLFSVTFLSSSLAFFPHEMPPIAKNSQLLFFREI